MPTRTRRVSRAQAAQAGGGAVAWHVPNRARPIAFSTPASRDLIEALDAQGLTWAQMVPAILFDPDAKAVAQTYVDAGYGDVTLSQWPYERARPTPRPPARGQDVACG